MTTLGPERIAALDPSGMLALTDRIPERAAAAYAAACALAPTGAAVAQGCRQVLVCGMGGSAISGDLWREALGPTGRYPVSVHRGPGIPAWAGPETLVLLLSYSGQTAETLSAHRAAQAAGCRMMGISSGGTLTARLQADGHPVVPVPAGMQPRAALAEIFYSLLGATAKWDGMAIAGGDVTASHAALATVRDANGGGRPGPALTLAAALRDTPAVLVGMVGQTAAVAYRWQTQINENAKALAQVAVFPELTHNEIVPWRQLARIPAQLVVLDDPATDPLVHAQLGIVLDLLKGHWQGQSRLEGTGEVRLARQLSLVALGDYVSIYQALLRDLDPTPVEAIQDLKRRMQEAFPAP